MKKALEAGIKFCNKNINYKYNSDDYLNYVCENYVRSYKAIHHVLKAMLKALDEEDENPEPKKSVTDYLLNYAVNIPEPEKPEPQGSVEELAKFMHSVYEDKSKGVGWSTQESCRVDWDDLPVTNKIVMRYVAYNVMQWLHCKGK